MACSCSLLVCLYCNSACDFINPIQAELSIPDEFLPLGRRERRPQHVHLMRPNIFFAEMTQCLDDESDFALKTSQRLWTSVFLEVTLDRR